MRKLNRFKFSHNSFCFLFFFAALAPLQAQLKVSEVIEKTLASNPELQAIRKKIDQAQGIRIQAGSPFNTSYLASVNKYLTNSDYTYYSPTTSSQTESYNYSVGVSRKLPWGMVVSPSVGVNSYGYPESYPQSNNAFINHGAANLKIVQPLLLGLGKKYNMAGMHSAQFNVSAAEHQYIYQASGILLKTLITYVQYIGAYQNLLIQTQTEATLTKSITDVNRLIALDALPASEVVLLQGQLYNQKAMQKLAENKLQSIKNQLGAYMGVTEQEMTGMLMPDTLFPVTLANVVNDASFVQNWLDKSIANRHDYMALEKNIQSAELDVFVSKKAIKPRLDLNINAGYTGTALATNYDQYYRPLAQNIPGMNYSVGLSFVFAGKNDLIKGRQMEYLSTLEILEDQKKMLALNIKNQVKQTGNDYQYNAQVVAFLSESEKNYKKAYQNEVRKFQAGSSTSFNVVQLQNDYLLAKNQLVSLMTDLNIAILEFRHQTGTLIEPQLNNTFNIDPIQIFTLPVAK
jgi:outer membrane protein TolC